MKKRGLGTGRGLDALLGAVKQTQIEVEQLQANESLPSGAKVSLIPVEQLQRGMYQPRRDMDVDALSDLAESIKRHGVMQPIVVRSIASLDKAPDVKYEIIAGERRWRAATQAGLKAIPAIIKDISNETAIALALIENIQREDLSAIEQAYALQRFQDEFSMSHQEIAETVGKARATVSNLMRLLSLNDEVKIMLERGDLDMGHARCLLSLPIYEQTDVARQVVAKALTVRQTEQLVRDTVKPSSSSSKTKASNDTAKLARSISEQLGAMVSLNHNAKGKGKLVIQYHSLEELEGILERMHTSVEL